MMFRSLIRTLLLSTLFTGTAVAAQAQESSALQRIVDSGVLRVGMTGSQPPFTVVNKDGNLIGYEVDLATLLAVAMGVELEFVQRPFGELLPALEAAEIDVIMSGMTMTPARNLRVAFVGPYMVSGKSILTKSSTLAAIQEAGEIDRSTITLAALEGSTSQAFVEKLIPEANLVTTKDYDEAVQMVLGDQADAMVADFPICALTILRHPNAGLATLTKPLTIEPIGMAVPPGDPQLLNMVENYLSALQLAGILEGLMARWFQDGAWLIQLP